MNIVRGLMITTTTVANEDTGPDPCPCKSYIWTSECTACTQGTKIDGWKVEAADIDRLRARLGA
jgi:hypothetical protein